MQSVATLDENDNPADIATLKLYGNDTRINLGGKLPAFCWLITQTSQ